MPESIQDDLHIDYSISGGETCHLRNFSSVEDIDQVVRVEVTANPYPWSERNFIDSVQSSHICLLATVGKKVVAHGVFSVASGDAELLILSVQPCWQGKGIARGMLNVMFDKLEDYAAEMFLEVRVSNQRAITLYESLGFNSVGTRPGYYPRGSQREDALIYARSLRIN